MWHIPPGVVLLRPLKHDVGELTIQKSQTGNSLTATGCGGDPPVILLLVAFKNTCLLLQSLAFSFIILICVFYRLAFSFALPPPLINGNTEWAHYALSQVCKAQLSHLEDITGLVIEFPDFDFCLTGDL